VNVPAEKARSIQYINRLRILAIYAVVTAHVAMGLTLQMRPFTADWWLGCWLFYIAHAAIPIFVMISGALLLDNERQESALEFYKRRLYRAGIPLVFWTVVYLVVRQVEDGEHLTAGPIVKLILTGDPYYHLWFLYMIAGLYLVTPVLRTFVRQSSQRDRLFTIIIILVLANAYFQTDVLLWNNRRSIFTMFIPFIGYYLCGYELRRIDPKKIASGFPSLAAVFSAIYLTAFAPVFLDRQGGVGVRYLFDFFSLPMVFLSIGIFWAAYLHDRTATPPEGFHRKALEWVASTTLGVYVLHPLALAFIKDRLGNRAGDGPFLLAVIVVPLVTFAACYLITSVMMNIPLLRRTVC
jgi:surface polysaccharide O-acyltransferase-like enzyme